MAGVTAIGAISKSKAPAQAVALTPMNGFAAEKIASAITKEAITENKGQFVDKVPQAATRAAQSAFLAEPLTPDAIAILALGQSAEAKRKLMTDAFSLSRRQPFVTGWLVADSAAREDVPALLGNYDIMIRTSSSAAGAIIPIMAAVLANDSFVMPFAKLMAKQPPWASQFWGTVIGLPKSLANAAQLRETLYKPDEDKEIYRDAELIFALTNDQQFDRARSLYAHLAKGKKSGALVINGSFNSASEYPPLDWQLISTGEYGAAITNGKLELSAIRNSGGLFARQLVKLPPRTLALAVIPDSPIADNAQIFVTLTCAEKIEKAPQAIRIPLKDQIKNLRIDNAQSGCSSYWLDISGRASESGDGFDIAIDSISLQ